MQKIVKSALALHLTLLIVILSGCSKVPVFPSKYIWEVDIKSGVCGQYEIIDPKNFKSKHIKDWPIAKCDGVFGFSTSDIPKVLNWCSDMVVLAGKCKK